MKSIEIYLNEKGLGTVEALDEVECFCKDQMYSGKETLRTRLLAEELLGMVKGIIGDGEYEAAFWIEGTGKQCELHVTAKARVDSDKKEKLMSVSSSGENMAARGIMGKIRQVVEGYLNGYEQMDQYYAAGGGVMPYTAMGVMSGSMMGSMMMQTWSLQTYIGAVQERKDENQDVWDELEKSIIASLADDVLVGVQNKKVEIIVKKEYPDNGFLNKYNN